MRGPATQWQLFGSEGQPPLSRGVVVGSTDNVEGRSIERPNHTIHGQPAEVGPSPDPQTPAGALKASWTEGEIVHDAIAVSLGSSPPASSPGPRSSAASGSWWP